jgi:hypothetical protein
MGRTCGTRGRDNKYVKMLVEKPEEKRPLGRLGCKWILEI